MPKYRFNKRLSNISPSIWSKIAKIDELKGRWIGGLDLSPQVLGRLKKSVLITSTGASTRIEGAKLSDSKGNVLPDCFLMKNGSTALDFAYKLLNYIYLNKLYPGLGNYKLNLGV